MSPNLESFERKLPAYFDGGLKDAERAQLEALVASSAEFAKLFRRKQQETEALRLAVPDPKLDAEAQESLEAEIREAIQHLFNDESAGPARRLTNWIRERL